MPAIDPYLFFPGNAEEAVTFYQHVFGGEVTITRRGDVDPSAPEDMKNLVINAGLVSDGVVARSSADVREFWRVRAAVADYFASATETSVRHCSSIAR